MSASRFLHSQFFARFLTTERHPFLLYYYEDVNKGKFSLGL